MKRVLIKILEEFRSHLNLEHNSDYNPYGILQEFLGHPIFWLLKFWSNSLKNFIRIPWSSSSDQNSWRIPHRKPNIRILWSSNSWTEFWSEFFNKNHKNSRILIKIQGEFQKNSLEKFDSHLNCWKLRLATRIRSSNYLIRLLEEFSGHLIFFKNSVQILGEFQKNSVVI